MRYITLLLLFITASPLLAQKKTEEVFSEKLNAKRSITVTLPPLYEQNKDKKYPLILVLDGEYLTGPFEGTLAYTTYWDELPEAIIVGVAQNYGNQREDDSRVSEETGLPETTGDKFFQFIGEELVPHLEKTYRISPYKVIAGHDVTATMASFFLYREKSPFTGFIAFSPVMATDMETRLPEMLASSTKPVFFYLCTAEGDSPKLRKAIKSLDEKIKAVSNPNVKYLFEDFITGSHYSLVPYGAPGALYNIFASYRPISPIEYKDKIETLKSGYVDYLKNKYDIIEKDLGVKMVIRLADFKAIEAAIRKNGMYDELRDLAALAKKNYPKKTIGEYYDGMYYEMTGDLKRAKKSYMNGYGLSPIGEYTKDFMIQKGESINQ
ncbi:histidine kinase [Flavobacterium rivuli WB 3.3-2 = DSM 21788]|uniref:Histidine kinase n=1 Tax=Flavobacterium rivuli WB 3.3-2 = DSM 21788 TaxID=1121895 RepID=A0A0A2M6M4_9FLAO|nr:alpha/beta hydrolase-fold protein [Flavobacterium rivuli]KGO87088.1 histidine kinase [Flavobacterium rivuli WB 3.3-2 = DSM 21788]